MANLTAFLILRNEELLLPRCLESLASVADEIVAVDTGSTDSTPAILAAAAAVPGPSRLRWQERFFDGFGPARQAALDLVSTEWALWIDADEVLSNPLRDRLRDLQEFGDLERCDAWEIPLENRVLGRTMRGRNLAGQRRVRLFRARLGRITPQPVHEGVVLREGSRIGRLEEPILHDTVTGWRRYLEKVDLYTDLETLQARDARRPQTLYLLAHALVTVPATFWREFAWRTGFRDGWPGLIWAAVTAWSSLLRDLKLLGLVSVRRGSGKT